MESTICHGDRKLPKALDGFSDINRYWDDREEKVTAKIMPGEYYVTREDEVIITVLGSCVAACVRDKVFGIGGMNHFMLPVSSSGLEDSPLGLATRFGNYAMEHLINEILKNGGMRNNLEVKLFGGGKVLTDMSIHDIGARNIGFIHNYVHAENLDLVAEDLGDIYPRKVVYHPRTGTVLMKKLRAMHNSTILDREKTYMQKIGKQPLAGAVELF